MEQKTNRQPAAPDEDHKMFRSTTGEAVRIALTTGHITMVESIDSDDPANWTRLHKRFWSHAFALGCESEDGKGKVAIDETNLDQRKDAILAVMRDFKNAEDKTSLFTKAGVPDANKLSEKLGFTVKGDERDVLWQEIEDEGDD